MIDADAHAVAGGSGVSATTYNNSSDRLPLTANEQCNPSVASTPTHSSGKSKTGGVARVAFPASPALSTLSKNTSSSGNSSFASAAKMSVDDILSSSKLSLGARQKAMRTIVQKSSSAVLAEIGKQNPKSASSSEENIRPQNIISSSTSTANALKLERPQRIPGQEERKKRLESLQQNVPQRQLFGVAQMKQQPPQQDISVNSKEYSSTQTSVPSKKRKGSLQDEFTSNIDTRNLETSSTLEDPSINSPTSRWPKRVKSETSHVATNSAKNNIISELQSSSASEKSPPQSAGKQSISITTCNGEKSANNQTNDASVGNRSAQSIASSRNAKVTDEPDEIDEPESLHLALDALLVKYDSCFSSHIENNMEGKERVKSKKESSPWNIVQSFVSVISHINLFDPSVLESEECRQVIIGLSQVFKSSIRVKWEVMNRNRQGNDDETLAATEAHLIHLIQVQVWMRMMVWGLEREAGWELLSRVLALADATWDEANDNDTPKPRKKKQGRRNGRMHPKQSKQHSAVEGLVNDLRHLMELVPYVLPASLNFSQWLKDTLTFGFRQPVPDYGAQLFDHFEIEVTEPIGLKRSGTDNPRQSVSSETVSHSPVKSQNDKRNTSIVKGESPTKQLIEKREKSQQAYFASLAEEDKSASNGADDESATATGSFSTVTSVSRTSSSVRERVDPLLLKTSVSLTAAAPAKLSNPFLKGSARGIYVGSHLGSKLSNITSLFREVKAPAKPIIEKKVRHVASKQQVNPTSSALNGKVSASADQNKRKALAGNADSRISSSSPEVTPFKRPRQVNSTSRSSRASMFAIEETPVRSIIDETPAKKPNPAARTRLRLRDEHPFAGSIVEETPQQQPMRCGGHIGLPRQSQSILRHPSPFPYVGNSIIAETPQQQPTRRNAAAPSSVLPTNLWHRQDIQRPILPPPPPRQPFHQPNNLFQGSQRQRQQMQMGKGVRGQQKHLSPIKHPRPGSSAPLNFGLSPMPNQEDRPKWPNQLLGNRRDEPKR